MTEEIQFFSPEKIAEHNQADADVPVSLVVVRPSSVRMGQFLDLIEAVAHAMALDVTVTVQGYKKVFYGWEKNVWATESEEGT